MALQYWINHHQPDKNRFLALNKGYHGDTFGVMGVSNPEDDCPSMHHVFKHNLPKHGFLQEPRHGFTPNLHLLEEDIALFENFIKNNHNNLAAFICEPIMQGAGGFNFIPLHI